LSWRHWDDEVVVYNSLSGQTHLLDGFSAAVLAEIERAPATVDALAGRLAAAFGLARDDRLVTRLAEACETFERLGLARGGP